VVRAGGKFGSFALPGDGALRKEASGPAGPFPAPASRLAPVDVVRARVTASIALGVLSPGERLPDPDTLAVSLDVSAITVRRALESLCRDGMLERRRGRTGGTFVSADVEHTGLSGSTARQVGVADLDVAVDRRIVIECGVLALVLAADPEPRALRALLDAPTRDGEIRGAVSTAAAEASFHGGLAALTGLGGAVAQVHEAIVSSAAHLVVAPGRVSAEVLARDHEEIVEALVRRDHALAVGSMRTHVDRLHRPSPSAQAHAR
jgi:DNA-binding FadR family transcriptional regulator